MTRVLAVTLSASALAQDGGHELPQEPTFLLGGERLDASGFPERLTGAAGHSVELSFYYLSPEDNEPGDEQFDHLQGFSMVLCYDCRLQCDETTFRVVDPSIATAVGVDFVSFSADNDEDDGDACEMAFAMLVEATPPFSGRTLPPTSEPLRLATVELRIDESAACGELLSVGFCNAVNVSGLVPLSNVYSAENKSFPAQTVDIEVEVDVAALFRRGDCNFDQGFNISDAIAVLNAVFFSDFFGFTPVCDDACDANDDGRLDLSDTMTLLRWLFLQGTAPPAPGTIEPGPDPTEDRLDCALPCADS